MLLKVFGFGTVSFLPIIEFAQILFLKIISMFPSKLRGEGGGMGETRNRRDYCTGGCVCVCASRIFSLFLLLFFNSIQLEDRIYFRGTLRAFEKGARISLQKYD